ncbi:GNAT family N-acetyltransferase [Roseobacter weihaiensis]|uniref:GNAT family N-acetyltransferase n=1 Tax=Roseobacter weihaiensis TaxID=2763262 RepID=UPI001D0A11E2|nr:GNAT family N-acetyltransferase [Roseobacter sp. H9]
MVEQTTIRRARTVDAEEIGDLYVASRAAALAFLEEVHGPAETKAWIRDALLPLGTSWTAYRGDVLCGLMTLNGEHIEQLYLRPDRRREGIGSALMAHAKTQSPHRLELYCFQENHAARAFYEAHGFAPIAFGDGTTNEEGAPDVLYEWTLGRC